MKKYFLLIMLVTFIACGKKGDDKNNGQSAGSDSVNIENELTKIDNPSGVFDLKYKFAKDAEYRFKIASTSISNQSLQTDTVMKQSVNQTLTYIIDLKTLEIDSKGIAEFETTITSITLTADIDGKKINYASGTKLPPEEQQKFIEYEAMSNTPFRLRVNQLGEIVEVTRISAIIDKIMELEKGVPITPEQRENFITEFGKGGITPIIQLIFRKLPEKSVGVDSTWHISYQNNMSVFEINNVVNYKIVELAKYKENKIAKISASLGITWKGNNQATENGVDYIFDNPKNEGGGFVLFNIDKGTVQKSETKSTVTMRVRIDPKGKAGMPKSAIRSDIVTTINKVELL